MKLKIILFFSFILVSFFLFGKVRGADQRIIPKEAWSVVIEDYLVNAYFDDQGKIWLTTRKADQPDVYFFSLYDGNELREVANFTSKRVKVAMNDDFGYFTNGEAGFRSDRQGAIWVYAQDSDGRIRLFEWENKWNIFTDHGGPLNYSFQGNGFKVIRSGKNNFDLPFKEIKGLHFDLKNNLWVIGTGEVVTEKCTEEMKQRGCENDKNWTIALIGKYDGRTWKYFSELDWNYPYQLLHPLVDSRNYPIGSNYFFKPEGNRGIFKVSVGQGTNKEIILDFDQELFTLEERASEEQQPHWSIYNPYEDLTKEESVDLLNEPIEPNYEFPGLSYFDGAASVNYVLENFEGWLSAYILKEDKYNLYFSTNDLGYESLFPPTRQFMEEFGQIMFSENPEEALANLPDKEYYTPDYYGEAIQYTKIVKVDLAQLNSNFEKIGKESSGTTDSSTPSLIVNLKTFIGKYYLYLLTILIVILGVIAVLIFKKHRKTKIISDQSLTKPDSEKNVQANNDNSSH